jgi:ABC-type bacteriocin/lantibiotic exporter with double-glycine peptidase domain
MFSMRLAMAVLAICALAFATAGSSVWLDVPFVKQQKDGCGAASIAMVMQYWSRQQGKLPDKDANAALIQQKLYSPKAHGIYASALEHYLQSRGYRTFVFHGDWGELQENLSKGRPLIVALQPSSGAALHYLVVAGLDLQNGIVLVNDPAQRKLLKEDQSNFAREWNATGKWTLLAVPQSGAR